jgi:hypothetical protein
MILIGAREEKKTNQTTVTDGLWIYNRSVAMGFGTCIIQQMLSTIVE